MASTAMAQSGAIQHLSKSFQSVAYNPSEDSRRMVIRELLNSDNPMVQMPAFPRIWHQIEEGDSVETNTSYGFTLNYGVNVGGISIGGVGGSRKVSINYSYSRRYFLVAMMSTRERDLNVSKVADSPLSDISEITRFDSKTQQRFYKVQPQFPIVAFCAYEMSLKIARNKDDQIFFPGYNSTEVTTKYRAETITLYSNFFQVEPHVPIEDYITQKCGGVFLNEARPFVENDFNKIVLEYYSNYSPNNNCRLGGESSEAGDHNCLAWFRKNVDALAQKTSVPRCLQQTDGTTRCALRAKTGASCPLYLDQNGRATTKFSRYREATLTAAYSRACDEGLTCTMERKPVMVGPLVLWPGSARCR